MWKMINIQCASVIAFRNRVRHRYVNESFCCTVCIPRNLEVFSIEIQRCMILYSTPSPYSPIYELKSEFWLLCCKHVGLGFQGVPCCLAVPASEAPYLGRVRSRSSPARGCSVVAVAANERVPAALLLLDLERPSQWPHGWLDGALASWVWGVEIILHTLTKYNIKRIRLALLNDNHFTMYMAKWHSQWYGTRGIMLWRTRGCCLALRGRLPVLGVCLPCFGCACALLHTPPLE